MAAARLNADRHDWVLAAPFRAHVRTLVQTTGVPWLVIALNARVPPTLVSSLVGGQHLTRIPPSAAARLLRVDASSLLALTAEWVPAAPSVVRLSELLSSGADADQLARHCRLTRFQLEMLLDSPRCTRMTELLVQAAWLAARRVTTAPRVAA